MIVSNIQSHGKHLGNNFTIPDDGDREKFYIFVPRLWSYHGYKNQFECHPVGQVAQSVSLF